MKIEFKDYQLAIEDRILISKCDLVAEGKIIELCGRNGVGKSTLINSMSSNDYIGEILIDDKILRQNTKLKISFIPQQPTFIEGSSVGYHLRLYKIKLSVGQNFLNEFDESITLKSNISKLSGGQRQLVNLMLGLLKDSDYLIIDEPFNFLSTANIGKIKKKIVEDKRDSLIVTHNNTFEVANKIKIEKRVITCLD